VLAVTLASVTLHATIADAQRVLSTLVLHEAALSEAGSRLVAALARGHKVLAFGNGGSAAEAMHLVTELVGRFDRTRAPLPAIALSGEAGMMSCIANDFSFDDVFARPLVALARPGDFVICFSTSGNAENLVRALDAARDAGLDSLALLGKTGGRAAGRATWDVVIDSDDTARIQEAHLLVLHYLCARVDTELVG
jgi:D-sedoheptulose 7-phosphate isomerase